MIVSHELKYVFIAAQKTGSSTLKVLLEESFKGEYLAPHHSTVIPKECRSYYVFSSVRNPYDRMKSIFKHARRDRHHGLHWPAQVLSFSGFCRWHANLSMLPELKHQDVEYTYWTDAFNLDRFKGREPCQADFLSECQPDAVLKLESIKEDFEKLPFAGFSASRPTEVKNRDPDGRNAISVTGMSVSAERAVYKWAKKDFDSYGYRRAAREKLWFGEE